MPEPTPSQLKIDGMPETKVKKKFCKEGLCKDMELTISYLAWRVQQPESAIRKIYNDILHESTIHKA